MTDRSVTSPNIERDEHDSNADAKRVLPVSLDLATGGYVKNGASLTERYDAQGDTIYTGSAVIGTSDSATGWTIYLYNLSDMTNASGKIATDVSWVNRVTGSFA